MDADRTKKVKKTIPFEVSQAKLIPDSRLEKDHDRVYIKLMPKTEVQWQLKLKKTGYYAIRFYYRTIGGDQVQKVTVKTDHRTLVYDVGFPMVGDDERTDSDQGGWQEYEQAFRLETGVNTLVVSADWGNMDLWKIVMVSSSKEVMEPLNLPPILSPRYETIYKDKVRDITIHVQLNGHQLLTIMDESETPIPYSIFPFKTEELESGYAENRRTVRLSTSKFANYPEGNHQIRFLFSEGHSIVYHLKVVTLYKEPPLKIISLDVNHGNATLIKFPSDKWLLIDSGKEYEAEHIVKPFLKENNITIDYYLLTHYHHDHLGGLVDITTHYGIRPQGINLDGQQRASKTIDRYQMMQQNRFADYSLLVPGDDLAKVWNLGDVSVLIVNSHFDEQGQLISSEDENHLSVAFRLTYKGFCYFHQADMYGHTQANLLKRFGSQKEFWKTDYLTANHHFHGSVNPEFLQFIDPKVVFIPANGAVYARGAYRQAYQNKLEKIWRNGLATWQDTILSAESGTLVCRVYDNGNFDYSTYRRKKGVYLK